MKNRPVKEFMVKDPITLNIDESFCSVAEIFKEKDIRHLPIVNSSGVILGVISQRDLNRIASPEKGPDGQYVYDADKLSQFILKQHVIQKVITLSPEDTIEKATELMAMKKLGCIPVVDKEEHVVGILTVVDLLKLLLKILREQN